MTHFPGLDEEPPRATARSRGRRGLLVILALVVLAGAGAGAWAIYNSASGGSSGAGGKVLAFSTLQQLVLANPDGSKPVVFSKLGYIGGHGAYLAPDGKAVITDAGDVVMLKADQPASHSTALYAALAGQGGYTCPGTTDVCEANTGNISTQQPFADGSADVVFSFPHVLSNGNYTFASDVVIVPTAGGRLRGMGLADAYAGDPQQVAVFVGVPADPHANGGSFPADTTIEHRVLGGATTTVVTAAQVAHDLGSAGNPALSLSFAPDPTGKLLAVQPSTATRDLGTAVYTRTGKLVGSTPLVASGVFNWSPSGKRLIFSTAQGIIAWTPGGATTHIPFPPDVASLQGCAWSSGEDQAACWGFPHTSNQEGPPPTPEWVLVDVAHERAQAWPGRGYPLLWEG